MPKKGGQKKFTLNARQYGRGLAMESKNTGKAGAVLKTRSRKTN